MKIGIYDPYLDDLGGGEKYMMSVALTLAEKHDVTLFWDKQEDITNLENRFSLDLRKLNKEKNIFSKKVGFLNRLKASSKYDALIILSDGSIPFTISKQLFLHIQQPLHIDALTWKSKLKLSLVSGIFYNSQFTASYNQKLFSHTRNKIIYPPVILQAKTVKKENSILHVGRFRVMNVKTQDYKKQVFLVDTFKNMVDKGLKNWKFVVATSIADVQDTSFQAMIASAKGYPIEFLINKSNTVLWDSYNKAKIYWHASGYGEDLEKHPEYAEHFGISTVEAMGAGAVPVVINAGGQKEIISDGKNGLLWNTSEELQGKTRQLITDEKLVSELSNAAKKRAEDFSYENFQKEVFDLVYPSH